MRSVSKAQTSNTVLYRDSFSGEPKMMFSLIVSLRSHGDWEQYAAVSVRIAGSTPVERTTGDGRNDAPESLFVSPRRLRRSVLFPLPTVMTKDQCGPSKEEEESTDQVRG